ncbi:Adenylyl cyclase-associated protein [Zea mays]|uniref:Adenylyl cyclase-associated protein n=1 Tax=Zea mays TaxID=4577 RepID=A0A1D6GIR0_MAIZE|nr:Adenylyl cyclase-associated protein [Zea mays]
MAKGNMTTTTNTGTGEGRQRRAVVAKPRNTPLETTLIVHQRDFQNLDSLLPLHQMPHLRRKPTHEGGGGGSPHVIVAESHPLT